MEDLKNNISSMKNILGNTTDGITLKMQSINQIKSIVEKLHEIGV